jgi:uroporphyrinogen-III synthase
MYRSVSADVKDLFQEKKFDIICFFTPSGVRSLFDNVPDFQQNGTWIGGFGSNTLRAIEEAGLTPQIKAPVPQSPSMITALDKFLSTQGEGSTTPESQ